MIAAVTHHAIPMTGASRIKRNVIVVPWKANVSGSTVKIVATTSVDAQLLTGVHRLLRKRRSAGRQLRLIDAGQRLHRDDALQDRRNHQRGRSALEQLPGGVERLLLRSRWARRG